VAGSLDQLVPVLRLRTADGANSGSPMPSTWDAARTAA